MKSEKTINGAKFLRLLPSIDTLLRTKTAAEIVDKFGARQTTVLARRAIDELRADIQRKIAADQVNIEIFSREELLQVAESMLENIYKIERDSGLRRVINATGVVIHTNLGRAPLSENAVIAIAASAGYCNLEYDIETGKRGKRGGRVEQLLAEITGAEDALVVNNCAAACVLILTALAKGGEAIISRSELVEIGGDFRIPDVMIESGAILREVGATNRTKISDYENAIGENTKLIVRVHPSNYRIVGFTAMPTLADLAELAARREIIFYEDAGSGALRDLSEYGLTDEPVIWKSIADGADVVSFSGDKLFGAAQAGLIVGRRLVIEKLRKHPLYRALRVGKLVYAALEATLEAFVRETQFEEIPVLKMLSLDNQEIEPRVSGFVQKLRKKLGKKTELKVEMIEGKSVIGGGSAPMVQPVSKLIALTHEKLSVNDLEKNLRLSKPPIITRILEDKVLIDLRTISENEEAEILEILAEII